MYLLIWKTLGYVEMKWNTDNYNMLVFLGLEQMLIYYNNESN